MADMSKSFDTASEAKQNHPEADRKDTSPILPGDISCCGTGPVPATVGIPSTREPLTAETEALFRALTEDREACARVLLRPSMRGTLLSAMGKYRDQAHFIYELLQNANDAKATSVRFLLYPERLLFAHNGTRLFSLSDPKTEDIDAPAGALGDLNAITSIGQSSKRGGDTVGQFGLGFKAAFLYTKTPSVYDPRMAFRLENFIVPHPLQQDHSLRCPGETLFDFPFNMQNEPALPDCPPEVAFDNIANKLRSLSYPLLFMPSLQQITWQYEGLAGCYREERLDSLHFGSTLAEKISIRQTVGENVTRQQLWLFTKPVEGQNVSVGFFLNEKGMLKPVNLPAFCFFPTCEVTGLRFAVHAPFHLTDNREGIPAGDRFNEKLVQALADLAAESLFHLRDLGEASGQRLITDDVLDLVPTDPDIFSPLGDREKLSFLPVYCAIRRVLETGRILPASTGCVSKEHAYWAEDSALTEVFGTAQLRALTGDPEADWVFATLGRASLQRKAKPLADYIDGIVSAWINEDDLLRGKARPVCLTAETGAACAALCTTGITAAFTEQQSLSWLAQFYGWVAASFARVDRVRNLPIFLNLVGKAVAAWNTRRERILFLSDEAAQAGYTTVHPELLACSETQALLTRLGIDKPDAKDEIINIVLPKLIAGDVDDYPSLFGKVYDYYKLCPNAELRDYLQHLVEVPLLAYVKADVAGAAQYGPADCVYYPDPEVLSAFRGVKAVPVLRLEKYYSFLQQDRENFLAFLHALGVHWEPRIVKTHSSVQGTSIASDAPSAPGARNEHWTESTIEGCADLLQQISETGNAEKSRLLWVLLLRLIEKENARAGISRALQAVYTYERDQISHTAFYTGRALELLRNTAWLRSAGGEFCLPCKLREDQLDALYDRTSPAFPALASLIGLRQLPVKTDVNACLTPAQKEKIDLVNRLLAAGFSKYDLEKLIERKKNGMPE